MKKLMLVICLFLLCGCASEKPKEEEPVIETEEVKEEKASETADIDLSFGSETIAYATITNILEDPQSYLDQKVKMLGTFRQFFSETYDTTYYVCMVTDATACCQQGMEFKLKEGLDEYPLDGQQIILSGTVDTYAEGDYWYAYLKDADYKVY